MSLRVQEETLFKISRTASRAHRPALSVKQYKVCPTRLAEDSVEIILNCLEIHTLSPEISEQF